MPSNLNQPGESAPYTPFVNPNKKKNKKKGYETYEQLGLTIRLVKGKSKFKNDPSTSANA